MTAPSVIIDCFPENVGRYGKGWAVVAIDVLRATTTIATGVSLGRRCFPVPSLEAAVPLAARLDRPLLVGELGGNVPYGFDLSNSPADLSLMTDISRPMILLSTSGTRVVCDAYRADAVYAACLRNHSAQVRHLVGRHDRVAVVGAGARGEFRDEDQLGCAWIAAGLMAAGFESADARTAEIVARWREAPVDMINESRSAQYLRDTAQLHDLDFVLHHIDDLQLVFRMEDEEIVAEAA